MIWTIVAIGALIVGSIIAWGWASQATAGTAVNLIEVFVKNWLYISSFTLLILFGLILLVRAIRGEIQKGMAVRYIIMLIVLGLFTVIGVPIIHGITINTYKVKAITEIYNAPFGPMYITKVYLDKDSWTTESVLSLYVESYRPLSWFDDDVLVNYYVECYRYGVKVHEAMYSSWVTTIEALVTTHEQWLHNLPSGASCTLKVWLSNDDEANPEDVKIINFVVPK